MRTLRRVRRAVCAPEPGSIGSSAVRRRRRRPGSGRARGLRRLVGRLRDRRGVRLRGRNPEACARPGRGRGGDDGAGGRLLPPEARRGGGSPRHAAGRGGQARAGPLPPGPLGRPGRPVNLAAAGTPTPHAAGAVVRPVAPGDRRRSPRRAAEPQHQGQQRRGDRQVSVEASGGLHGSGRSGRVGAGWIWVRRVRASRAPIFVPGLAPVKGPPGPGAQATPHASRARRSTTRAVARARAAASRRTSAIRSGWASHSARRSRASAKWATICSASRFFTSP
jgi:hypothetical protein